MSKAAIALVSDEPTQLVKTASGARARTWRTTRPATGSPVVTTRANPVSVPAGQYGRAALEILNGWRAVESRVVRGDNVRSALAFVERGEAAAGIVYATDAAITKKVAVVGTFPEVSHPPITYPLAIVAGNDTAQAREFRAFMLSDTAKAIYRKYGFAVK
jgi:molybdate transport system substrate-binding protein